MTVRRCPRGHRIVGRNVAWYSTRGKRAKRCRRCTTAYQRRYMRRRRRTAKRGR